MYLCEDALKELNDLQCQHVLSAIVTHLEDDSLPRKIGCRRKFKGVLNINRLGSEI